MPRTGGYSIIGLNSNSTTLFIKEISSNGTIRNLSTKNWYDHSRFVDINRGLINNVQIYNNSYRSFVSNNYGIISNCTYLGEIGNVTSVRDTSYFAPIATKNYGTIKFCENKGINKLQRDAYIQAFNIAGQTHYYGGIVVENYGQIESCVFSGQIITERNVCGSEESGCRTTKFSAIAEFNREGGSIISCIHKGEGSSLTNTGGKALVRENAGIIKASYSIPEYRYWLDNVSVNSTPEKMQTDQFAWILNTMNGTAANSKVWSRINGYPVYATDGYKPIYKVVFNDDGTTSNRYTNYKGQVSFPEDPEPAEGYVFTGWYNGNDVRVKPSTVFTSDQTVNSVYVDASNVFWTINFYNSDTQSTLLETHQYQHGSIVTYGGATPTRVATAKYTYTFKGWDVEPTNAVEDFDYHAVYDSTLRSYTITFNDYNGSKIESKSFKYGVTPSCSKTPARPATVEWNYTHKGWTPELASVTGEASYKATYDSAKVQYKVTFMNGSEVIDEQMVPYGSAAVAPTNVTREGHKFVGWNVSFSRVTEALTVKALFEELVTHTVDIVNADGETIGSVNVEEDANYTLPEAPDRDGYTFDAYYDGETRLGVAGDEILVSANIIIIARYIENPKSSSSGVVKSSSSKATFSSSSNSAMQVVVDGKLEQAVAIGGTFEPIVFKNVQSYQRNSWNMYFLNEWQSGNELTISGTLPNYLNSSNYTETLTINGQQYIIKLSVVPSVNSSSGTEYISNSSANGINSSASGNALPVFASTIVQFSVMSFNRNLQILGAKVGSAYAIFDMQGRVLKKGRVESANFNIPMAMAGNFLVRIGGRTQRITIK